MNFDELDNFLSDTSFSDETDDNFKEENAIVVASIDWSPMPEAVSWQDPNFAKEIVVQMTNKGAMKWLPLPCSPHHHLLQLRQD